MEPRILIADDDGVSRLILQRQLERWGFTVTKAHDGAEAWAMLTAPGAPDLAIVDWMMPGIDGVELCRRLRERKDEGAYKYVILLTACEKKDQLAAALHEGIDDYLVKPFDPLELEARITVGRRILALQSELIAARERLRRDATYDDLTGLWNRKAIVDILKRDIGSRERSPGRSVAVVLADIDGFKRINDTWGHQAGDQILASVSRCLHRTLRTGDALGRYGGEEFLVVLPESDLESAVAVAERMRTALAERPMAFSGGTLDVTLSAGVAVLTSSPGSDWRTVVGAADEALYRAKRNGRNRVEAAPDVTRPSVERPAAATAAGRLGDLFAQPS